jgi:hypothetical protein
MQAGFEAPTLAELEPRLCGWFFLNGRYHPAAMFNSVQEKTKCFLVELPSGKNYGIFEEATRLFLSRKSDPSTGQDK